MAAYNLRVVFGFMTISSEPLEPGTWSL